MVRFEKRGVVAKICADSCIIMTPQGTYDKIPLPTRELKVGAEVSYRKPGIYLPARPWIIAASVLLLLITCPVLHQAFLPQPVAFVSLDINPSLEMSVGPDLRIIDVQSFNDEAANLLQVIDLQGISLDQALSELITQAIAQNYITYSQENIMISTISPAAAADIALDQKALYEVMENTISSHGFSGQVKIYSVSGDFHLAANQNDLSAGKYLIYEQLVRSGNKVTVDDVKQQSISQLAGSYRLALLPNYKQIMIQTAQADQLPKITVDDNGEDVAIENYFVNQLYMSAEDVPGQPSDINVSRSFTARKSRQSTISPLACLGPIPEV